MYTTQRKDKLSAEDFHEKVSQALGAMETCLQHRMPWSCVNDVNITDVVPDNRVISPFMGIWESSIKCTWGMTI